MAPTYDTLGSAYAHASSDILIAKVDADAHKELGKRFGVQGFPTLKWFDGKSEKPEDYNGGRELDDLAKFVEGKTSVKAKVKRAESNIVMLNDAKWNSSVGAARGVFVAFTAPWCGRKFPSSLLNDEG
jgi:protein disulfide-isomerase A6